MTIGSSSNKKEQKQVSTERPRSLHRVHPTYLVVVARATNDISTTKRGNTLKGSSCSELGHHERSERDGPWAYPVIRFV